MGVKLMSKKPSFTPLYDDFIARVIKIIGNADTKVFLAINYFTFGWQKEWATISISELVNWTGLTKKTVRSCLNSLAEKEVIIRNKVSNTFEYKINFNPENANELDGVKSNPIGVKSNPIPDEYLNIDGIKSNPTFVVKSNPIPKSSQLYSIKEKRKKEEVTEEARVSENLAISSTLESALESPNAKDEGLLTSQPMSNEEKLERHFEKGEHFNSEQQARALFVRLMGLKNFKRFSQVQERFQHWFNLYGIDAIEFIYKRSLEISLQKEKDPNFIFFDLLEKPASDLETKNMLSKTVFKHVSAALPKTKKQDFKRNEELFCLSDGKIYQFWASNGELDTVSVLDDKDNFHDIPIVNLERITQGQVLANA